VVLAALWMLGVSLFNRRKKPQLERIFERRRVTGKQARDILKSSIDRFSDAMDKSERER